MTNKKQTSLLIILFISLNLPSTVFAFNLGDYSTTLYGVQFSPSTIKEDNIRVMLKYIEESTDCNADLIVFPELCITQYFMTEKEHIDNSELIPNGPTTQLFANKAKEHKVYISWGMVEKHPKKNNIFITQVLVGPEGYVGKYRKTHLVPSIETTIFKKGNDTPIFHTKIGTLAFAICYDRRFPELSRKYSLMGTEILIVPSATTENFVDNFILNTRAYENSVWLFFVNQVGEQKNRYLTGGSRIISPKGRTVAGPLKNKEGVVVFQIPNYAVKKNEELIKQRRNDLYILHQKQSSE
jgi:predicted amidohydrolase